MVFKVVLVTKYYIIKTIMINYDIFIGVKKEKKKKKMIFWLNAKIFEQNFINYKEEITLKKIN